MRGPSPLLLLVLPAIWLGCHEPVESDSRPGTIEVSVAASGLLTDTATYGVAVSLDGRAGPTDRRIPYAGGQVAYEGLVPGTYAVRLESPGSCWVVWGDQTLRIVVAAGRATHVHFETSCFGPPDRVLTRTASGSNLAPSRFVLEQDGAFRLQFQDGRGTEVTGTYLFQDSAIRFWFATPEDDWSAIGTVAGSCLSVDFNESMEWADFVDGTYCGDTVKVEIPEFAATMPEARWGHAAAALNGVIYIAGGESDGIDWDGPMAVLAFDPLRRTWRTAARLVRPVMGPAMAAIGDRLYLAGGCPLDSASGLQVIDPASGRVILGPPIPTPRCMTAAAVLDGKLHVIGGIRPGIDPDSPIWDRTTEHEVFDPATDTWSTRAPLPNARSHHGAVTLDGKIYVAGGQGELLQVYDPATDTWTTYPSPPARWSVATVAAGGAMYVIGGGEYQTQCCDGPVPSTAVQRFDPTTGTWASLAPLAAPRTGHAVALVGGTIYVLGGTSKEVERIRVP